MSDVCARESQHGTANNTDGTTINSDSLGIGEERSWGMTTCEMDETNGGRHSKLDMAFMQIPAEAIACLARVLHEGAKAHNDPDGSNWRRIPMETHLNHALYHINAWQRGVYGDEDHLAHAMTRLVMAYTVENGG